MLFSYLSGFIPEVKAAARHPRSLTRGRFGGGRLKKPFAFQPLDQAERHGRQRDPP
jgi:hypothetical protein